MEKRSDLLTVETTVNAPIEKVWECFTKPEHVINWNHASDDWHSPYGENDLRVGGKFNYRMEAKDGSVGFDFGGIYDDIKEYESISYTMDDGREVNLTFISDINGTKVIESFVPENTYSLEHQQQGWQSILDNFKKYTESI